MANPTVDKLKVFGLRHGEKVAMGVVAVIFATCAYFAWSVPSIDITPDEVKSTASKASANIGKQQNMEQILKSLDAEGVKPQDFEKRVDALQAGIADASKYKIDRPFVQLEPGAGLIRDRPELLAPQKLFVHAGRGAVRVFVIDDETGLPKPKAESKDKGAPKPKPKKSAGRGLGLGGGGLGGLGGLGGGSKKKKNTGALAEAERKKEEEQKEKRKNESIARDDEAAKQDEDEAEEAAPTPTVENSETQLKGYRFASIVGVFDHEKQKENYAKALKVDVASADPHYQGLEIERQERQGDNTWGPWKSLDPKVHEEVDAVLTKIEEEVIPTDSRISTLVDRLPFLEVGYWVAVHHPALVPKDILKKKKDAADSSKNMAKGGKGMMPGSGNQFNKSDYDKMGMGGVRGGYGEAMSGNTPMSPGGPGAGGAGGSGPDQGVFEKSKAEKIMVRGLDFGVEPDSVYRYRVRIVVANPNYGWSNVAPGVDTKVKQLKGPWSEMTAEVGIPADIATFAAGRTLGVDPATEKFAFEVAAWNETDGMTVVKKFDPQPGDIIGSKARVNLPDDKKDGALSGKDVEFTSNQILADALGGDRPANETQPLGLARIEVPMVALVVRADGVLVVRDEAQDAASGEMVEMKEIHSNILKDAAKGKGKKEGSSLMGAGGGYGGYGGYGGSGGGFGAGGGGGSAQGAK